MATTKIASASVGSFRVTLWPHGVMVSLKDRWTWVPAPGWL